MLAKRIIPCLDVDNGRVVKGISFVTLDKSDVVRHRLVKDIINAYERHEEGHRHGALKVEEL